MGRIALSIVAVSFVVLLFLTVSGGDIFLSDLRVAPEEILGKTPPAHFEVEQSYRSQEGDILVGIDRENQMRLHVIRPLEISSAPTSSLELFKTAKNYRIGSGGITNPSFPVRYLSANVDPRRSDLLEPTNAPPNQLFIKGPKTSYQAIWFDQPRNVLFIATHPNEKITPSAFANAVGSIAGSIDQKTVG